MSFYSAKTGLEILVWSMLSIEQNHRMKYETKKRVNDTLDILERETFLGPDFIAEIYKFRRLFRSLEPLDTIQDEDEYEIISDQIKESMDKCLAILACY